MSWITELFLGLSFWIGAIFIGFVLIVSYLGLFVAIELSLLRAGRHVMSVIFLISYVGMCYYTYTIVDSRIALDPEYYRFGLTVLGLPFVPMVVFGLVVAVLRIGENSPQTEKK